MALISNQELSDIGDKLARFAAMSVGDTEFDDAFTAGMQAASDAVLSGGNSIAQYILDTDDEGVTADLLPAARDLDEDNPSPPARFIFGIASVSAMITALNTHLARYSAYTTLDSYLTSLNASSPTLRFHQAFHDHLKALSRKNVFSANDTVLATFSCTGATTGTFASVTTIGTSYAGAKLVVKNQGGNTSGATLTVTGKKIDGTTQALTVTVSSGTDNDEQDLSVTTQLFVEVTNITITSGTNTDVYEIVAKTDRDISAA